MEKEISCVDSAELGKASRIVDAAGRYIEFCARHAFPNELSLSELTIVVDCANGATLSHRTERAGELGRTLSLSVVSRTVKYQCRSGATDVRALRARAG